MNRVEEQALIKRAVAGEEPAFDELVCLHHEKLFKLVYNIVKNEEDAKEVSQQTWLKIWKKLDTFKGQSAFYTWAYRIATFTSWDFLRKKKRKSEVAYIDEMEAEGLPATRLDLSVSPAEEMTRNEIMETFHKALNKLSENHRTALILREIEGLSYEEIAQVMDCQKGTVMSRIFNARKAIQNDLEELR